MGWRGIVGVGLTGLLVFSGCGRVGKGSSAARAPGSISFAEVNEKVFRLSCVGCHGTQTPLLSNYEQVKANLDGIRRTVFVTKTMPKRGNLSEDAKALLKQWLDEGGPEKALITPETTERAFVSWAEVQEKVIKPRCVACHFKENPGKLSNLEDYETFKAFIGSTLFITIANANMPPAPAGTPEGAPNPNALSRGEKELLSNWVVDGMRQ